jgi:hypothetical protein
MSNIYDTRLECVTNYELLKFTDPKKIIINTCSKFRFSVCNDLVFESHNCTMHDDILLFSQKFPREVFLARYYDISEWNIPPALCFRYEDGQHKFIGYEPIYIMKDHELIYDVLGEEIFLKLWKRIKKYLFRLDQTKEYILDGELRCDPLEHHYDDCVSSNVTINAEYENYKLSVEKYRNSELRFHGYKRISPSEEWEEIIGFEDEGYSDCPF